MYFLHHSQYVRMVDGDIYSGALYCNSIPYKVMYCVYIQLIKTKCFTFKMCMPNLEGECFARFPEPEK